MIIHSNASMDEQLGLSLLLVQQAPYSRLRIRDMTKSHWVLSHVVSGSVTMSTGGNRYTAAPGQVMVHPPHIPFDEENAGEGLHQVLFLDITLSQHLDLFRILPVAPVVTLSQPESYRALFGQLLAHWNDPDTPLRTLHLFTGILELVKQLILGWEAEGRQPRPEALNSKEDRFMEVIRYMEQQIKHKVTREDLASLLHLHPNYFDKLFYKHFQQTPMHMLRSLRIRKAKSLLETTQASLESIAYECGLGDAAYFTRAFKNQMNETPGHYRSRMQKLMRWYGPEER
ncbi:AraC family transcriptional regulator [Paenibacillus roseipurpureus]|uniref:AraC family transcriptional regulator n=1 Tax=Paenibacillus roseopurpureus TaxID=2918901 RepID=A0AA96LLR2_9BACL|nr:AraC family transcriptional regulator [Paenibacillus sp. MBLB1832]WNR43467.1 AraC family transcriptional regulator [Paenibacillus sp. MBLB1832]